MPYTLPPLPYDSAALEPHIDAQTMRIHHDKHHRGYVDNLNAALDNHPEWHKQGLEALLIDIAHVPSDILVAVRNNAGGHHNHSLFWLTMMPQGGGEPAGRLAAAIRGASGTFTEFREQFSRAATTHFGSGWAWLVVHRGSLEITTTANQDSPLMDVKVPILGLDVWEHAYYLKYQNRRAEYVAAWWNVVNWAEVARRYDAALESTRGYAQRRTPRPTSRTR